MEAGLKVSRAASLTQNLQPASVPGLGLHCPLWYVPCPFCLLPGTLEELPPSSPFTTSRLSQGQSSTSPLRQPRAWT